MVQYVLCLKYKKSAPWNAKCIITKCISPKCIWWPGSARTRWGSLQHSATARSWIGGRDVIMGGKWDKGRGRRGQGREEGRTPPPMSEVRWRQRSIPYADCFFWLCGSWHGRKDRIQQASWRPRSSPQSMRWRPLVNQLTLDLQLRGKFWVTNGLNQSMFLWYIYI